jgi:hypothetical protein
LFLLSRAEGFYQEKKKGKESCVKKNSAHKAFVFCYSLKNVFFFASPKKKQKKSPEIENSPISGGFPDGAFVLL